MPGDVGIALAAFWCAALLGEGRNLIANKGVAAPAVFFAVGLIAIIGLEYLHIELTGRWTYDVEMPTLPIFGTGLSPILQWGFVPMLVLFYMRRLACRIADQGRNPG